MEQPVDPEMLATQTQTVYERNEWSPLRCRTCQDAF